MATLSTAPLERSFRASHSAYRHYAGWTRKRELLSGMFSMLGNGLKYGVFPASSNAGVILLVARRNGPADVKLRAWRVLTPPDIAVMSEWPDLMGRRVQLPSLLSHPVPAEGQPGDVN